MKKVIILISFIFLSVIYIDDINASTEYVYKFEYYGTSTTKPEEPSTPNSCSEYFPNTIMYESNCNCYDGYSWKNDEGKCFRKERGEDDWISCPHPVEYKIYKCTKYEKDDYLKKMELSSSDCDTLLGSTAKRIHGESDPAYYINLALDVLKYAAIIILVVITIKDFAMGVLSKDDEIVQKSFSFFVKRLILCIVIFVLPILLNYILELANIVDNPLCGLGGVK